MGQKLISELLSNTCYAIQYYLNAFLHVQMCL